MALVFGVSIVIRSITVMQLSRARVEKALLRASRFTFRLTFGVGLPDLIANVCPPPTQTGERREPARALPVPFCLHGLRPPPLTSLRLLVDLLPRLRLAISTRTAS